MCNRYIICQGNTPAKPDTRLACIALDVPIGRTVFGCAKLARSRWAEGVDSGGEKDMNLQIDEDKHIAYIKLSGQLRRRTILDAFDATVSDKKYQGGMGRLWDFRDADLTSLESETIVKMAQYSTRFPAGINDVKVAFVVSRDVEYGLSRMFEMSSGGKTPIRVFRTMDDAEKWMME